MKTNNAINTVEKFLHGNTGSEITDYRKRLWMDEQVKQHLIYIARDNCWAIRCQNYVTMREDKLEAALRLVKQRNKEIKKGLGKTLESMMTEYPSSFSRSLFRFERADDYDPHP